MPISKEYEYFEDLSKLLFLYDKMAQNCRNSHKDTLHFLFVIRKIMHNPESHELTINHRPNAQMGFLKT